MFMIHKIKENDGMVKYRMVVIEKEDTIIWGFEHRDERGMSDCLRRAAEAIEFTDPLYVQKTRKG